MGSQKNNQFSLAFLVLPWMMLLVGCSKFERWMPGSEPPITGKREPMFVSSAVVPTPMPGHGILHLPKALPVHQWPASDAVHAYVPEHMQVHGRVVLSCPGAPKPCRAASHRFATPWAHFPVSVRLKDAIAPIVVEDRVHLLHRGQLMTTELPLPEARGKLRPLLARRWVVDPRHKPLGGGGGLLYADNRLWVASGGQEVFSLRPDDYTILWRTALSSFALTMPSVTKEAVVVASSNATITSLHPEDGSVQGAVAFASEDRVRVDHRLPLIPGPARGVWAADSYGSLLWLDMEKLGYRVVASLPFDRATIRTDFSGLIQAPFMRETDGVLAYQTDQLSRVLLQGQQQPVWSHRVTGMHDIWAAGSLVFVSHGLHELSCYDRESGGLLWRTDLNDLLGGRDKKRAKIRLFGPILVEGTLLLTTSDGRMLGVDPTTGEVMGSVSIPATYTRPMVYRGRLHIMGTDSTFYGLSGLPVWEKRTDGKEVPSSDIRPVVLGRS